MLTAEETVEGVRVYGNSVQFFCKPKIALKQNKTKQKRAMSQILAEGYSLLFPALENENIITEHLELIKSW